MILLALLVLAATPADTQPSIWTPNRVYDTRHHRFADLESAAAELARDDVVFLGETHDDPATHRMELAVLEAVARRRSDVVLALEMFERDVQPALDAYLAGTISEDAFLKVSRPWPNYATDYRPLVEFAREHHWRVIAGNVPRRIAATVSSKGLDALKTLPDSERSRVATDIQCPHDDYFTRFVAAMGTHPMGDGPAPSKAELGRMTATFYQAQCIKDETMAESVARLRGAAPAPLVIHVNGDFHSDYGLGTAARVRRRLPHDRIAVVSMLPVASLDTIDVKTPRKRGDWLVFVLGKAPSP
ncbi:MAG TPA: ChaN family lipoprotein [Gemmatimonadales bacterium]|nr:ChaN family lipoprotein [Gemmatimonadales bacterium]